MIRGKGRGKIIVPSLEKDQIVLDVHDVYTSSDDDGGDVNLHSQICQG